MAKKEVFTLPNDRESKKFIKLIRKHLNRETYGIRVRGRHSNRKQLYADKGLAWNPLSTHDVKIKDAETLGVYLDFKSGSGWGLINDELISTYRQAQNNANISQEELNKLQKDFDDLQKQLRKFKAQSDSIAGNTAKSIATDKMSRRIKIKG